MLTASGYFGATIGGNMYKIDIVQIDKEWLKGRPQECVCDSDGNVVAVCGENRGMALKIAGALNGAELSARAKPLVWVSGLDDCDWTDEKKICGYHIHAITPIKWRAQYRIGDLFFKAGKKYHPTKSEAKAACEARHQQTFKE